MTNLRDLLLREMARIAKAYETRLANACPGCEACTGPDLSLAPEIRAWLAEHKQDAPAALDEHERAEQK